MKPYLIVSDVHCHDWSQFSKVDPDGVNSRLRIILDELLRAAKHLTANGGDMMVVAGDLFHVRGSVKPSVLNPVFDTFKTISGMGVQVFAIAGNHDLEGKDASKLGNAMQSLGAIEGFFPVTEPFSVLYGSKCAIQLFPWYSELDELRAALKRSAITGDDAVIHAPVNGILKGIPDVNLDPVELASFGFNRVFSGHFHNHKELLADKVWSCGATTHQTWSDPGTLAGFMMVWPDRVEFHGSHAPSFLDLTRPDDIDPLVISGNYVRIKLTDVTEAEIKAYREELESMGAAGVSINATKKLTTTRTATVKSGATLEASVADFIDRDVVSDDKAELQRLATAVLQEARAA